MNPDHDPHELRNLAAVKMAAEAPGDTLNATALVHEAYLRLVVNQSSTVGGTFSPPRRKRCGEFSSKKPAARLPCVTAAADCV